LEIGFCNPIKAQNNEKNNLKRQVTFSYARVLKCIHQHNKIQGMKKVLAILAIAALASCGGSTETEATADTAAATTVDTTVAPVIVDTVKVDTATKAAADTTKK
jgi:uncharacterized lipoprotein YajG